MTRPSPLEQAVVELHEVMKRLRQECPWDRQQSHDSLRRYLIEECHEVLDALDRRDRRQLKEELGDLLFQVWFHAEIASEDPDEPYGLADILDQVREKLVARHPHVFAAAGAQDAEAVRVDWEKLKLKEGRQSRLDGLPPLLPALQAALSLQDKAARVGFDWPDLAPVLAKVEEELHEFLAELPKTLEAKPSPALQAEFGDLLFSLVNVGRWLGINPEDALRATNSKFRRRFQYIEAQAKAVGIPLEDLGLDRMDDYWNEAKAQEAD